jgi:O-antigen ligase
MAQLHPSPISLDRGQSIAIPVSPGLWPLRLAMVLFALGTVHYVERDVFHGDESLLQPLIELTSVAIATCISFGAFFYHRPKLALKPPYLLLLGTLVLSLASSARSWDPLFSFVRGSLILAISTSTVLLLQVFGFKAIVRSVVNSYVILIFLGILLGLVAPDEFPLSLRDPGQETLRARLHLFKIHPIALADNCAVCLLFSVVLSGRWIRFCRFLLVTVLLLTVSRASIILSLPLYAAAEFLIAGRLTDGIKRVIGLAAVSVVLLAMAVGTVTLVSGWSTVEGVSDTISHVIDATRDATLNGRTTFWSVLIDDLSLDNLYGYGVGGARYYLRTVNPYFSHSHNSALETIYMAGYVGLAMVLVALIASLAACVGSRENPAARVTAVALIYIVSAGMMNPSWYETSSVIALSIACSSPWIFRARYRLVSTISRPVYA